MVQAFVREEDSVFDEDSAGSQDEGEEQVDVNVVPGAVELPAEDERYEFTFPRNLQRKQIVSKTLFPTTMLMLKPLQETVNDPVWAEPVQHSK